MKGKKFYLILIGLIVVGIGSIFVYRQQEKARALEFEGYEISSIELRVDELYNEDKTDIRENIASELFDLEQIFLELDVKDLSYRSESQIHNMKEEFLNAKEMHELQEEILKLFVKGDIVRKSTSNETVEELESSLIMFEDKTVYFKRNNDYITDARVQLETIEEATKLVESLAEDGIVSEDLELEDLEKAEELIKQIKDKDLKESLMDKIDAVRLALVESEEEVIVLEETEDSEEEDELEEAVIDEFVEEEVIEEESVEIVQENTQRTEQSNTSTVPNNNRAGNTQQTPNNTRSNSTQNKTPSNGRTNNTPKQTSGNNNANSTQSNEETTGQENNQSDNQRQEAENVNESKPATNKNYVAEKYRETKEVERYNYSTRERTDTSVPAGTILEPGKQGNKTVTHEVTIYNNGASSRKFISENITLPKDEVIAVGGVAPEPPAAEDE